MSLSIIIPHSGRPDELAKTVSSLRGDQLPSEIIVSNMGDPLPCRDWELPLKIVQCEGAWSVGRARNVGAKNAISEKLFFLDCDITAPREFVAMALDRIGSNRAWAPIVRNSDTNYNADPDRYRVCGYGNFGISALDFARIGGFDEFFGWGDEDRLFKWKCDQSGIHIHRQRSTLIHRDHPHVSDWHRNPVNRSLVAEVKKVWRPKN